MVLERKRANAGTGRTDVTLIASELYFPEVRMRIYIYIYIYIPGSGGSVGHFFGFQKTTPTEAQAPVALVLPLGLFFVGKKDTLRTPRSCVGGFLSRRGLRRSALHPATNLNYRASDPFLTAG